MPLIKTTLQSAIETKIKSIEPKLKQSLDSKSEGIYKALSEIDSKTQLVGTGFNINEYKRAQWLLISNEWSKVLAKQMIETLSKELSQIIADEVDKYIKSATIIVPQGQAVAVATPAAGAGVTSSPSPPANIS